MREYPWGRCEALSSKHSDMPALKKLLFEVAYNDLKDATEKRYYAYREQQLLDMDDPSQCAPTPHFQCFKLFLVDPTFLIPDWYHLPAPLSNMASQLSGCTGRASPDAHDMPAVRFRPTLQGRACPGTGPGVWVSRQVSAALHAPVDSSACWYYALHVAAMLTAPWRMC